MNRSETHVARAGRLTCAEDGPLIGRHLAGGPRGGGRTSRSPAWLSQSPAEYRLRIRTPHSSAGLDRRRGSLGSLSGSEEGHRHALARGEKASSSGRF